LIKFEGHQTFDQKRKTFLLFARLMGDVLFVWTAAYQTCLMRACVPRLLSGLYELFHLCLIKHVLTVWPLTSALACLVTKQCLIVFGRQTFIVCPGPYRGTLVSLHIFSVKLLHQSFTLQQQFIRSFNTKYHEKEGFVHHNIFFFVEVWKELKLFTAWFYNRCFYSAITITL